MATPPSDPQHYRRRQRRRAVIGWIGGLLVLAALVFLVVHGGNQVHRKHFKVPYGEVMTSRDYAEIHEGEEAAVVLETLDESGRPERLTEEYVLVLFPPAEEGVYCTYWEFSDEPQIFARLCFATDDGELVEKRKHSVLHPPVGGQGQVI